MIDAMRTLPPLAAIRVFEAAARHENYSRAAEELALTQAGVSYQIRLLEERLGARLFMRKGRGIALTALGRRIAPRVSESFAALEETFASVRAENETVLNVTVSSTFGTNWLARRIGSFNLARPELAIRLDVTNTLADLATDDFDIAIRGVEARPSAPGMVSHFLMHQHFAPMATPEFLARHPLHTPADLLSAPRVSPGDEWWGVWFAQFPEIGFAAPGPASSRFDSQVLDGNAALAGQGLAVLSPAMFPQEIADGRLVQPFPQLAVDPRRFWLVYPEHKRRLTKVRAFRDWLLQSLRETMGDDPHGMLRPPDGA